MQEHDTSRTRRILGTMLWSAWVIPVLALPILLAQRAGWEGGASPLLWIGLTAIAVPATWQSLEFSIGGKSSKVLIEPVTLPLVVAYLTLAPWQAGITALIVGLATCYPIRHGTALGLWLFGISVWVASAVATTTVIALAWPAGPPAELVLAAALLAVTIDFWVDHVPSWIHGWLVYGERRFLQRDLLAVEGVDRIAAAIAAALIVPLAAVPLAALAVLAGLLALAALLARMSAREQRYRSRADHLADVFSRYVPASVASQVEAEAGSIDLGGQERTISVLFCDIRGFTAWAEQHPPEQVVAELNVLLGELSAAVMATGGTLDKYTGDGLMAFWGAPVEQPDHAERACAAARRMLRALREVNATRAESAGVAFEVGIGIHSGPAVVGNIGHEERLDYTAIGDTVNLAARLEAATKDAGCPILVSDATHGMLADSQASCTPQGLVTVKGRREPVRTWAVRQLVPVAGTAGDAAASAATGLGPSTTSVPDLQEGIDRRAA